MVTILMGQTRSQFLAIPNLTRFLLGDDSKVSLAVKTSALQLKYFVAAERLALSLLPLPGGGLAYAVTLPDDPDDLAYIWSIIESDNEIAALNALLDGKPCSLHLFNELAVNAASTAVHIDGLAELAQELRAGPYLQMTTQTIPPTLVTEGFDALHQRDNHGSTGWRLIVELGREWHQPRSWYHSNAGQATYLSIFDADDGAQQEALCLWLTDVFAAEGGAQLNPTVTSDQGKSRELCDVLLTSDGHSFVIESKALAVLNRAKLPSRNDLRGDVIRHIAKATKQVAGAVRFLRLGYPVRDHLGNEIDIDRERPLHLIILVPELSLLSSSDNLGKAFLTRQIEKTECFVHLLDPAQLLRVVQASSTIARRASNLTEIAALDWYLRKRLAQALELDTPHFDFLLRIKDDA